MAATTRSMSFGIVIFPITVGWSFFRLLQVGHFSDYCWVSHFSDYCRVSHFSDYCRDSYFFSSISAEIVIFFRLLLGILFFLNTVVIVIFPITAGIVISDYCRYSHL